MPVVIFLKAPNALLQCLISSQSYLSTMCFKVNLSTSEIIIHFGVLLSGFTFLNVMKVL